MVNLLNKYKDEAAIVYCFSRKETEDIAGRLRHFGFKAAAYHAGMDNNARKLTQEAFKKDAVNIIVATIAFGMGIDKPDVRLVAHYTFPKTLEGYYQEIGRAGRDGLPSECVMFYTYADLRKHKYFLGQIDDIKLLKMAEEKLAAVLEYAESVKCRKKILLGYFGEELDGEECGACDACAGVRESFDGEIVAKKILSAAARTGGRFGKNHIVDILIGKRTQKIAINGHDKLSVFGIVNDFTESQLDRIIRYLIDRGLVFRSEGRYPALSISEKGKEFLLGKEELMLPRPRAEEDDVKKPDKKGLAFHPELFSHLRALRKKLAEQTGVPPFVVFGDAALQEMAYYFPRTDDDFLRVSGVGVKKLDQYGGEFITAIEDFVREYGIHPDDVPARIESVQVIKRIHHPSYYAKTRELLMKKIPIKRIARSQNLAVETVINHIEKLADDGACPDIGYLKLPQDRFRIMEAAFKECGDERLKPVFEYLEGKYTYDELRLARILLRIDQVFKRFIE